MKKVGLKFFAGLAVLLLAIFLEILLASIGFYFNLVLAALIAFSFVFTLPELGVFILFSVFILNWQPAPSVTLIALAGIPLVAYFFRRLMQWEAWVGNAVTLVLGILLFHLAAAPDMFFTRSLWLLADVIVGLIVGEGIFALLS